MNRIPSYAGPGGKMPSPTGQGIPAAFAAEWLLVDDADGNPIIIPASTDRPGSQGVQGPQGIQGLPGAQGQPGAQGIPGQLGVGVTIRGGYGTVAQLPQIASPGDAYVVGQNVYAWDASNGVWLNCGAIVGAPGPQGLQGIPGAASTVPGPQGIQGIQGIQGAQGLLGLGGPEGPPGKGVVVLGTLPDQSDLPTDNIPGDAYFIGTQLFVWTGTEWTASGSLQGPQGIQGVQGVKGDVGATGVQGIQGIQGLKGDPGLQGNAGQTGDAGPAGPPLTIATSGGGITATKSPDGLTVTLMVVAQSVGAYLVA